MKAMSALLPTTPNNKRLVNGGTKEHDALTKYKAQIDAAWRRLDEIRSE
jgi:hypothetical protein